jgi:transposase-like protein
MPFCEIVGLTCTKKTFNIAMALITREDTDTYTWILQHLQNLLGDKVPEVIVTDRELGLLSALRVVFPHVQHNLCHVHILRNCEDRAMTQTQDPNIARRFKNSCQRLFMTETEEAYERRRRAMHASWGVLMAYVQQVWLTPYRENIVRAWTDRCFHIGTRTTNR